MTRILGLIPGAWLNFWGGLGSVLVTVLACTGGMWAFLRKHNCEVHRCWRIGRHGTAAGHSVCRKHHPDGKLTAGQVAGAHAQAGGKAG